MSDYALAPSRRRFTVALGAALLLGLLFGVLLSSGLPRETRQAVSAVGLLLGGLAVVGSCSAAARRSGATLRRSWVLLASAAAVALVGNVWSIVAGIDPVLSPSLLGEASLAVAVVLSIFGLLGLTAVRRRGPELLVLVLDGLVMGCAVLVITSIVVYAEVLDSERGGPVTKGLTLLLPLLDVALVTVALLLIVSRNGSRVFFGLVGGGFLLYAVADLAFAVQAAQGTFAFGGPLDLGWIGGYLLLAAAAWHPHVTAPPRSAPLDPMSGVQGTVVVFAILLGALLVQLTYEDQRGVTPTQVLLWLLLVVAAGIRQTVLVADNSALRAGLEERVRAQTADLRRLARQTETLLTSVGDGIYGVDLDGRITFVNPSGCQVLDYPAEELLGRDAHDLLHAPTVTGAPYPVEDCYVTQAIRSGRVTTGEEDTYLRAGGETVPVEITASPLLDDDRVTGAVVVFRDVTQRHEVDRMKNEFLSVVSHELRTPLTSIRGSLGLLASGGLVELPPQADRMVSIAVESSDRLTRLINDILDIERIQSGKLPMSLVPQDARALADAAAAEVASVADAAGVLVEVHGSRARVLADADRIVQTLTNLVGNAVKFAPTGSTIRVEAVAEERTVLFAVRDHGRGIPDDKLESVFQPFEQVDSSDARQKGGTGLGLAISKGIVERHGGRIWAESTLGQGTSVLFRLPRLAELQDQAGSPASAPTVLVCDDDPGTVAVFSTMLARHGYRPIGVTGGDEAVERAAAVRPAAVLLDMVMPGTPGAAALARLKADPTTSQIPVLVVSGMAPAVDPTAASTATEWLVKPVSEERLIAAVQTAVEGRQRDAMVLLVEDDEHLAGLLVTLLARHGLGVVHVATVADALARGREIDPHVVVLDLELPDGDGTEVVARLRAEGRLQDASVVVYTATDAAPSTELQGDQTVFLTKARVSPEELESRVLRLVDAVTAKPTGDDLARSTAES